MTNKIIILTIIVLLLGYPTYYDYGNEYVAWFITDLSRVIQLAIIPLFGYLLIESDLRQFFLLYFVVRVLNVFTVINDYWGYDTQDYYIFYVQEALLITGVYFISKEIINNKKMKGSK